MVLPRGLRDAEPAHYQTPIKATQYTVLTPETAYKPTSLSNYNTCATVLRMHHLILI
jgi:hypothetical protein